MDERRFDALTRLFAATPSRRAALGALLGASLAGTLRFAEAKKNDRKRKRRIKRGQATLAVEAADCLNPGPSSNMNECNFNNRDFAGQDLSSSSMRGTRFRGADLCGADLSSSQLKNADFRGFAAPGRVTNLTRADLRSSGCNGTSFNDRTVFCRTLACNGSINNRDCPDGVDPQDICCDDADCPEGRPCRNGQCCAPICAGQPCGADDGCGGTCPCPDVSEVCVETGSLRCCCPGQSPFPQRCIANAAQQICCCPDIPPFPSSCRISPSGATCCCTGEQQICVDTGQGPQCQIPGQP